LGKWEKIFELSQIEHKKHFLFAERTHFKHGKMVNSKRTGFRIVIE